MKVKTMFQHFQESHTHSGHYILKIPIYNWQKQGNQEKINKAFPKYHLTMIKGLHLKAFNTGQAVVIHTFNLSTQQPEAGRSLEFEVNLIYRESYRIARPTQRNLVPLEVTYQIYLHYDS